MPLGRAWACVGTCHCTAGRGHSEVVVGGDGSPMAEWWVCAGVRLGRGVALQGRAGVGAGIRVEEERVAVAGRRGEGLGALVVCWAPRQGVGGWALVG